MADEVKPHVLEVVHIVENLAQPSDRAPRDLGNARLEVDRRHDVRELYGLRLLRRDSALLESIAEIHCQARGVLRPGREDIRRQVLLGRLA